LSLPPRYPPPVNSVALITGASRGIGRGIAHELARAGFDVIINFASDIDAARQSAEQCVSLAKSSGKSIRAEVCQADIGESAGRQKLIDFARARFARLHLLINNAGVAPAVRADLLEATEESFDRLMRINVK